MLASTALALVSALPAAGPARAQDATWLVNPFNSVNGIFNVAAYWDTGSVPTGTAYFGLTATPNVSFSTNTAIGGWTFNAPAEEYTFTNYWTLQFVGAGIVFNCCDFFNRGSATIANGWILHFNNSSSAGNNLGGGSGTTISNSHLVEFHDQSTAGSAAIDNNGTLNFYDTATGGSASITGVGTTNFYNTSTAGSASINNSGSVHFYDGSSASSATIANSGGLYYHNTSTAGSATIANSVGATLGFYNTSTAGTASITNSGTANFNHTSTAGSAGITNNASGNLSFNDSSTAGSAGITNNASGNLNFNDSSTAGSATIANSVGATLGFYNTSTAGTASITNSGTANFNHTGTAGSATITNNNGASLNFYDTSTGGGASISNNGTANFRGTSTAGTSSFTNTGYGLTLFYDTSTAGSATITNNGSWAFQDTSSAGSAAITNNYSMLFYGSSTAASATITTNYALTFRDTATAGNATITSSSSGNFGFYDTSTAGSAAFTNNGSMWFNGTSTAGSASIDNNGALTFYGATTADNATITNSNGHTTEFRGNSTAGNARLINNGASAVFDFSASTGPNGDNKLSAGSIAGDGTFNLGGNELTAGGNNLSTTVSGVISGSGGALVKTGTGTMTLTGTNTYTGGTTFSGGTVSASSDANLGDAAGGLTFNGGALQVTGTTFNSTARTMTLAAGGGTFDIANAANQFTVSEAISGAGGLTKSGAGTLILTAANTYSGATTINLGYLTIQDSIASSTITNNYGLVYSNSATAGSATITNHGELAFDNDATAGSASITNSASGIMYIRDNGTTSSATITNAGSIVFNDNSTAGSAAVTNNNELTFYSNTTAGSATITNTGTVLFDGNSTAGSAQLINNGSGAVVNFFTPGPASDGRISAGSLAGDGRFDLNSVELTVGSNNLSTEVTGVLTGDGLQTGTSLIKTGTGTLTLSGTNTYTGATTVNDGALVVNGSIAASSSLTMNSGTTLGGTGFVPTTVINSGATLASGNSIGTITVNGNLTFNAGTTYSIEVSPTAADRTNVTGTATLTGATVQAIALPGSFRQQTYTILNATGGFGGTQFAGLNFSGSSIAPGARNPHLTYDTNNVFLVLDPGAIQLPAGANGNQASVAGGINKAVESGVTPPAAFDTLLNMSGAQLTNALNQVSGQPSTGAATSATQMTTSFMTLLLNPNGGAVGGTTFGGARSFASEPALSPEAADAYAAVTPKDKKLTAFAEPRWSVWGQIYGGYNKTEGDSADTTARTWGLATGFDYRAAPDLTFGFALAGGSMNWALSEGLGGGKSDVLQLGAYGRKEFGPAYLSAALSYAWHGMSTDRTVTVSGTDKLTASFDAHSFGGRIETGTRFATRWVGVTPYAALQVQNFRTPSYSESAVSGSNAFALSYDARSTTATRTELGAWFDNTIALERGNALALRSRAAWAHDHSNNPAQGAAFQTLPGSSFTVNGAQAAPNSLLTSLGAELRFLNRWSIGARLDGEFASGSQTYAGTGTLRYAW